MALATCMVLVSGAAFALTGIGTSATGVLETVRPTLDAVAVMSWRTIDVTFSEPMLAPGVTTPGDYAISGPGQGALATNPASVTGSGPYTLAWTTGSMIDGQMVTVAATGLQDAVGNPIDTNGNSGTDLVMPMPVAGLAGLGILAGWVVIGGLLALRRKT